MWLCLRCESAIEDKSICCPVCEEYKEGEKEIIQYCIHCGEKYIVNSENRYCIKCGNRLTD